MTVYYLDPASPTNGTGTQINPFNTLAGLATSINDSILIKSGTTYRLPIQNCLNAQGLTIGMYGDGAKPIIDGSMTLDNSKAAAVSGYPGVFAWAFNFAGTVVAPVAATDKTVNIRVSTSTTQTISAAQVISSPYEDRAGSFTNDLGMVEENGAPMKWVPWNTDLYTTVNTAASASGHSDSTSRFNTPGMFTIDPVNKVLFVMPSTGTLTGNQYDASVNQFGVTTAWPSTLARLLTIRDLDIRRVSTHAITAQYRSEMLIEQIDMSRLGGRFQNGVYVGNGIELSLGTDDSVIRNCVATDIFDTGYTTQLYDVVGASVRRHDWNNVAGVRCGMSTMEISLQNGKTTGNSYFGTGVIEHVFADGVNHDNSQPCWAEGRGKSAILLINNAGGGSKVANCRFKNVSARSSGVGAVINSQRTGGVNVFSDVIASGFAYRAVTSFSGATQTDVLCRVSAGGAADSQLAGPTIIEAATVL